MRQSARFEIGLGGALLLLMAAAAGFLMVITSADLSDFAPVQIGSWALYTLMVLEGLAAALFCQELGALLIWLVGMDVLSLVIFVGAIVLVFSRLGIPLEVDLVLSWATNPALIYTTFMVLLQSCGLFVGLVLKQW